MTNTERNIKMFRKDPTINLRGCLICKYYYERNIKFKQDMTKVYKISYCKLHKKDLIDLNNNILHTCNKKNELIIKPNPWDLFD